jgi:hypothetical protein
LKKHFHEIEGTGVVLDALILSGTENNVPGEQWAACEETMHKALPMMEVYPLTNEKVVRFHRDCYTLWNEERRALES